MTTADTAASSDPSPPAPSRESRWRIVAAVAAVVAVVSLGVAAFAVTRDDGPTGLSTRDVAATQQAQRACQQWFDRSSASGDVGAGWCGHLSDWMYDQMASGHMMGSAMWQDPTAMHDTCVRAMTGYAPADDDPATRCQGMVEWMRGQTDDWTGWMMNPSMMGR
jgi:hypothetical protein